MWDLNKKDKAPLVFYKLINTWSFIAAMLLKMKMKWKSGELNLFEHAVPDSAVILIKRQSCQGWCIGRFYFAYIMHHNVYLPHHHDASLERILTSNRATDPNKDRIGHKAPICLYGFHKTYDVITEKPDIVGKFSTHGCWEKSINPGFCGVFCGYCG